MNAQILDISAQLKRAQRVAGCERCSRVGARCGPHLVDDVAGRLREHLIDAQAELLVSSADVVDVITEALDALEVVVTGSLSPHERSAR